MLPVGAQTAGPNRLKLRMEVGLDLGTDIGWVCLIPVGVSVKTEKMHFSARREPNLDMTHKTKKMVVDPDDLVGLVTSYPQPSVTEFV